MFFAENSEGILVEASQAAKEEEYICRGCGETVRLRAIDSKSRRVHFAHLPGSQCEWQHADMSEWHLAWQARFPEKCREVGLEKDGVKHRADVLIGNIVIEFQHSDIMLKEFQARNTFYLGCGKGLIWIFDMTDQIEKIEVNENRVVDSQLSLKPKKNLFEGYNQRQGYTLFFQDGERMHLISYAIDRKTFRCMPNIAIGSFLKDFGCSEYKGLSLNQILNLIIIREVAYNPSLKQNTYRNKYRKKFRDPHGRR